MPVQNKTPLRDHKTEEPTIKTESDAPIPDEFQWLPAEPRSSRLAQALATADTSIYQNGNGVDSESLKASAAQGVHELSIWTQENYMLPQIKSDTDMQTIIKDIEVKREETSSTDGINGVGLDANALLPMSPDETLNRSENKCEHPRGRLSKGPANSDIHGALSAVANSHTSSGLNDDRAQNLPLEHTDSTTPSRQAIDLDHGRHLTVDTERAAISNLATPRTGRTTLSRFNSTPVFTKTPDHSSENQDRRDKVSTSKISSRSEGNKPKSSTPALPVMNSPLPLSVAPQSLSLAAYLQLELSRRPSQHFAPRPTNFGIIYESSRAKIERLLNFIFLPYQLESILCFGTLACLDAWLYTFTILPLRLLKSFYILGQSWMANLVSEIHFVTAFVYSGSQRMWKRRQTWIESPESRDKIRRASEAKHLFERPFKARDRGFRRHRRTKSVPSMLLPEDKADMLKGLLIISTSILLLRLDASRMYHWVRGQAAIKLYVIYNVLEVLDRLLSALGQDVLECLFSQETLERKPNGRSKISRPFWLFILALCYTAAHSTALFYQVVTLNVAVNSYSNALMTLLLSNQFVEIKSTVFKKFEKDNLFQLTCADVVERFQLWHMLLIIAARNIVETGGLNVGSSALASAASMTSSASQPTNTSTAFVEAGMLPSASGLFASSFALLPSIFSSFSTYVPLISQIVRPFAIVLGSEMLIDWLKHAYINKFNNTRPVVYSRFLDVLAKDYYTNAFGDHNLNRRLGLPLIPLACLLIRASVQTYHMFVAAWLPPVSSSSSATLASIHEHYTASRNTTPTSTTAAVAKKLDNLLLHLPSKLADSAVTSYLTTILIVLLLFLILLACKLILGMLLLSFSRMRYRQMKEREKNVDQFVEGARRFGGWGVVEVDDEKLRLVYEDDLAGYQKVKDRQARDSQRREQENDKETGGDHLDKVMRYDMVAKRIW